MTNENVVQLVSPEEKQRRLMVEVHRLAELSELEWTYYLKSRAQSFIDTYGVSAIEMKALIQARLKDLKRGQDEEIAIGRRAERKELARTAADKKAKAAADKEERKKQREEREKEEREEKEAKAKDKAREKEFITIRLLPVADRDARLQKLADQLKEDVSEVRNHFAEFLDNVTGKAAAWDVAAWDGPVTAAELLQDLTVKIHKHVVLAPRQALAVALWIMLAWVHEVAATYSPYLVATSADAGEGKSTLIMKVVGRLTPRPFRGGDPTAAIVFRTADAHKPTLLFDNVDTLFERKPDLTNIFEIGYDRGVKVPRAERINGERVTVWFDPFCPKACNLIGTNMPRPLLTRLILIRLKLANPAEAKTIVEPTDDEEFATLCRKLKRWSDDNAAALKGAPPSPDFINRERNNWNLQLAIAGLAGGEWPARALEAARVLTRTMEKPSWKKLLLMEFQDAFFSKVKRKEISSEDFYQLIKADPLNVWHEYNHGTGMITQRQIAFLLSELGIHHTLLTQKRISGYRFADFADAFATYLPGRVPKGQQEKKRRSQTPSRQKAKRNAKRKGRRG